MASIIKANELQDFGGNSIITSDGAGNVTVNAAAMKNTPAFFANLSTLTSITGGTKTKIQFNEKVFDTDSAYDNSTNYRFTVPSGKGGKYFLFAGARKNNFSGNRFFMQLRQNNAVDLLTMENTHNGDAFVGVNGSTIRQLSAGDTIQADVYHNDSSTREVLGTADNTYIGGYKLTD